MTHFEKMEDFDSGCISLKDEPLFPFTEKISYRYDL